MIANWTGQDCLTGNRFKEGDEEADRGNDGKTTSKSRLALNGIKYYGSWELQQVEEAGYKIYSGAPTVSQTTRQMRDEMKW